MFCPSCGKQVSDGASFCPECGQSISGGTTPENDEGALTPEVGANAQAPATSGTTSAAEADNTAVASDVGKAAPPKNSKRTLIIIVVIVCAVILAAVGGFLVFQDQQRKSAEHAQWAAHTMHAVIIPITAPGYDDATCSKIPVHVTGTDVDGQSVQTDAYLDSTGRGLQLMQGEYTVTVVASPLLANGTIYTVPTGSWVISIGDDVDAEADVALPADKAIVFTAVAPLDITDAQIDAAYKAAVASGVETSKADGLKAAVVSARQAALDQKAAEEAAAAEAQRQAEAAAAEAARKAALHHETSYFSIDLPDSWSGCTINDSDSGKKCTITSPGNLELAVVSIKGGITENDYFIKLKSLSGSSGTFNLFKYNIAHAYEVSQRSDKSISSADVDTWRAYDSDANMTYLANSFTVK